MKVTIVGSGPAAAGAALALVEQGRCEVEIVDVGNRLEPHRRAQLESVSDARPADWPDDVLRELSRHPVAEVKGELPQKRLFGSDFPFRDAGQLAALTAQDGGNRLSVSGAFGGFSNAWGAQVMPFSRPTLEAWPVGADALRDHYRTVLERIPFAGADDDYSDWFPLLAEANPLPRLAPPAEAVLQRYMRRRSAIRSRGVTVGQARLAMNAPRCIECGLCLTGCPYDLVYASSHTLGPLIERGDVRYRDGLLVEKVGEDEDGCWIQARDVHDGSAVRLRSDRVLLACGGLGTTRVALNSLRLDVRRVELKESVQLVLPFISARAHRDPRTYSTFTLNQFNMLVEYGRPGLDLAQVHLYPYNPVFEDALPGPLRRNERARREVLRRITAGLGYLPSWASPSVDVQVTVANGGGLPGVHLGSRQNPATRGALARVFSRMLRVAPALDLWPVIPSLRLSGPAKSYHFGGSFPHVTGSPRPGALETDLVGRPSEWKRIHLIDASVFPTVAATTFTLTIMANAHRIGISVAKGAA